MSDSLSRPARGAPPPAARSPKPQAPGDEPPVQPRAALGKPLAWLALLAPLPLPFNDVIPWPAVFVFWALIAIAQKRFDDPERRGLSDRALNLLGLAYIPVLIFDASLGISQSWLLRPLLHLILFLLVAKLWSLRRSRDPWHVLVAIFFLFVASMATSTHITSLLYLLASLGLGLHVLGRFLEIHVAASAASLAADTGRLSAGRLSLGGGPGRRRSQALALFAIVLLAAPIFASLPRLREPFLIGRGGGNLGASRATGFSDSVDLSLTSEIRDNPSVALRLEPEAPLQNASDLRLKGAAYDLYRDTRWERGTLERRVRFTDGIARVAAERDETVLTVYREPLASASLPIPYTARAIGIAPQRIRELLFDAGGATFLPGLPPRQTMVYTVRLGDETVSLAVDPGRGGLDQASAALDRAGISPRLEALTEEIAGDGTARERADRIERHLLEAYDYTLDFVGREGVAPVDEFLFEYRSGHCELFATSMVLMLRSEGIPARFVTGFLGAEANTIENFYVVRQSNAHAWVEAWFDDGGWQVYDPTPPDGRPLTAQRDLRLLLRQLYDFAVFRWDRYVLTYGVEDQQQVFADLRSRLAEMRERLAAWWAQWRDRDEAPTTAAVETDRPAIANGLDPASARAADSRRGPLAALALALATAVALLSVWARRRAIAPARAYERLRQQLGTFDPTLGEAAAPLELRDRASATYPEVAEEIRQIVDLYVAERFAGQPLASEHSALRPTLLRVSGQVRRTERRRAIARRLEERRAAKRARRRRSAATDDLVRAGGAASAD